MKRLRSLGCLAVLAIALATLMAGCSKKAEKPVVHSEKEKQIIRSAEKAVAQFEDWADRAEFRLQRKGSLWHVTALRVVYPEAKGNMRYVPWGRREMVIDDAGKLLSYANDK